MANELVGTFYAKYPFNLEYPHVGLREYAIVPIFLFIITQEISTEGVGLAVARVLEHYTVFCCLLLVTAVFNCCLMDR